VKWEITGKYHATSTCGRYIVNWTESKSQYQAVRLGKPDRGAWIGSVALCVGARDECLRACEGDANERDRGG
jgi:hypothetical protein